MSTDVVLDALALLCLLGAGLLSLAAGVGLLRFPDLLARLSAATKPQVLGLLLVLLAVGLRVREAEVVGVLVAVAVLQLVTVPVSAHLLGRAAYRTGSVRRDLLRRDDLARLLEEDAGDGDAAGRR